MNGESMALQTEAVIFPLKIESSKSKEIETGEISRVRIEESKVIVQSTRFARLKKSLRKRAAGIL